MCKEQGAETREMCNNGLKNELQEFFPMRDSLCVSGCMQVCMCECVFFLTACRSILLPS